ncbi:hypothetical protein BKA69DRAFT_1063013 [Paraphysoderma sedebokerense]|nr:hypothetical protein BKA69DRAFT_1063013 [Paraphysoderma sedebokerense]
MAFNSKECETLPDASSGIRPTIHIIYPPSYEGQSYLSDLSEPLKSLGFETLDYFVTPENVQSKTASIPKEDIVFLHYDMPPKCPRGTKCIAARYIESHFPNVVGAKAEYSEICTHKSTMNAMFAKHGVSHCRSVRVERIEQLDDPEVIEKINKLRKRFFIKVDDGFNSMGTGNQCVLDSIEDCLERARQMVSDFGPVMIQHFLSGREFTVAVSSSRAYHPVERIFRQNELVSPPNGTAAERLVPKEEIALIKRIQKLAYEGYRAVGGTAYGRVDIRMDDRGELFVLEVNNTCAFGPQSYFEMSCKEAGSSRRHVLREVLSQVHDF